MLKPLPKTGQNLSSLVNWRPITLANCDSKLLSKILAKRLGSVITELVGPEQEGFIKGRWIGHAAMDISTILNRVSEQENPCAMVFVDQQKAYDRVD